jgi:hypothetical protein
MRKLALLLVAAPLVLAACGSSSPRVSADRVAYVKHAAQKTADIPSEHMTVTATVGAGPINAEATGSGDFANATKKGQMSLTISALGQKTRVNEVLDGSTVYAQSPMLGSELPNGKTWTKVDLRSLSTSTGINYASLMSQSPTQTLKQLLAAGSVKTVDTATIDGVETTHYQITNLDLSKLPGGAKIEALIHPKYAPIDVWIGNKDGYVHRESLSFTYTAAGQSGSTSLLVNLSKFGENVNVKVPPASELFTPTGPVVYGVPRS